MKKIVVSQQTLWDIRYLESRTYLSPACLVDVCLAIFLDGLPMPKRRGGRPTAWPDPKDGVPLEVSEDASTSLQVLAEATGRTPHSLLQDIVATRKFMLENVTGGVHSQDGGLRERVVNAILGSNQA